jgi:cobalt-zinc-cadmium efflux system outer membrane protein
MPEPLPIPSAAGLPRFEVPMYGRLTFPGPAQDEGPTNGLTLDAAIEVLVRQNLNLRAQAMEIPMARADVLTANLRSNPILFVDSQLIPYGTYTAARPGGQTQYDLNINYPLDITRKRQARTRVACAAERVIEAQYQDAVRLAIDALYAVYVDVLAARETIRLAQASVDGLQNVRRLTQEQQSRGAKTMADVRKVDVQLQTAELGLAQAQAGMTDARRNFAILLGRTGNDPIEVRGMLRDVSMTPEPPDRLVSLALASRPDLAAYRLGIRRAHEEVGLAKANRMSDVYLLYQPYTFQDNAPIGLKSAHSWAVGLTIPLPVYNRNQGNIQRAHWNAAQAQLEVAELERRVQGEVERAYQAYAVTSSAVVRYEGELLPAASEALENALRLYRLGEEGQFVVLDAQREYNTVVRDYLEALIRRRRSMLELNTAVGQRILP